MNEHGTRRIILITGATSGLGHAMAAALADEQHELILTCRDRRKGECLASELAEKSRHAKYQVLELNLASFASIESFTDEVSRLYERVDVLFNNAGLYKDVAEKTAEGFEMTVGVNYLGAYYLTRRLLPLLSRGKEPQIIQMCSFAALLGTYRDRPGVFENHPHGFRAYLNSKTMQLMMTVWLADELKSAGITVNAVQPGVVSTGLWKGRSMIMKLLSFRHQDRYTAASAAAEAGLALVENAGLRKESGCLYKAGGRRMRLGLRYHDLRWIGGLIRRSDEAIAKRTQVVYIGTYTDPERNPQNAGEGIYICRLDYATGCLMPAGLAPGGPDPSYLTLSPTRRYLYAVNERPAGEGRMLGAASAFAAGSATGGLVLRNCQMTEGADPCHVIVDDDEAHVFITNYSSGSISVFPVREDGSLGEMAQIIRHEGRGTDPVRQESPHPHSSVLDKPNRHLLVMDLGLDQIMIYRYNPKDRQPLSPAGTAAFVCRPGAGPRHGAFHTSGKFFYVINELDCTICAYRYDSLNGRLRLLQTVPALPAGQFPGSTGADIHVSNGGHFLYASIRGHDSIVCFMIKPGSGMLKYAGHFSSGGRTPRNFTIDLSGTFLLAANQGTGNISVFRADPRTGALAAASAMEVPAPVCVKTVSFFPEPGQKHR